MLRRKRDMHARALDHSRAPPSESYPVPHAASDADVALGRGATPSLALHKRPYARSRLHEAAGAVAGTKWLALSPWVGTLCFILLGLWSLGCAAYAIIASLAEAFTPALAEGWGYCVGMAMLWQIMVQDVLKVQVMQMACVQRRMRHRGVMPRS